MIAPQPWHLRCSLQFLDEVAEALYDGGVWVTLDASCPDGLIGAVTQRMSIERWRFDRIDLSPDGAKPAMVLAETFGVAPSRLSFANPSLNQHAAILDLRAVARAQIAIWTAFLRSYATTRQERGAGLSFLVIADAPLPGMFRPVPWQGRIRRADSGQWADSHAVTDRPEPLGDLVHATAVELFGWRLDLVRAFIQAGRLDVLSPLDWLERRTEDCIDRAVVFNGRPFECPLFLLRAHKTDVLRNRLWRAQLAAVFPWIEERRQDILDQYADALELSDLHRERFKVASVMDLEISEIARQLRNQSRLPRDEQEGLDALGELRRDLAHRKPVTPRTLEVALRLARP